MSQHSHATNLSQNYSDKSQTRTLPGTPLQKELHDQLNKLESNFAKMQAEYTKKIKEMKNILVERSKKSHLLNNEIMSLQYQFNEHEKEIKVLMKDFQVQEDSNPRKNYPVTSTSPLMIQKNLDSVRRTQKNPLYKPLIKNSVKLAQNSMNLSIVDNNQPKKILNTKKAYSPAYANNHNKTISIAPQKLKRQKEMKEMQALRQKEQEAIRQKQAKRQRLEKQINVTSFQKLKESQGLSNKNKKDLNLFLCASLNNLTGNHNKEGTNSPKRIVKRSPNNNFSSANLKKQVKTKLGNIKQDVVQIF